MKRITPARLTIALLLLVCGGLIAGILRQKAHYERTIEEGRQSRLLSDAGTIYGNLMHAAESLPSNRDAVLEYTSMRDLSDQLERAAAYLEKAEIGMQGYYRSLFVQEDLLIEVFDSWVFERYASQLAFIAGDLKDQDAITPEQMQIVLAIQHDISLIHETFVIAHATKQSTKEITARMQAITPTLKLNSVRQRLDLFPSIFPQNDTSFSDTGLVLTLSAPANCAEVGQPVTFTLELVNLPPGPDLIAIEAVDIVVSGSGREERWSASGAAPENGDALLASQERRIYQWVWTASEEFRDTTVLVEARAPLPKNSSLPTPDPNSQAPTNLAAVDLTLGIGILTQTWEERMVSRNSVYEAPPRTLPCAQMVR